MTASTTRGVRDLAKRLTEEVDYLANDAAKWQRLTSKYERQLEEAVQQLNDARDAEARANWQRTLAERRETRASQLLRDVLDNRRFATGDARAFLNKQAKEKEQEAKPKLQWLPDVPKPVQEPFTAGYGQMADEETDDTPTDG